MLTRIATMMGVLVVVGLGACGSEEVQLSSCSGVYDLTETVTVSNCPAGISPAGSTFTDRLTFSLAGTVTTATRAVDQGAPPAVLESASLETDGVSCIAKATFNQNQPTLDTRESFRVVADGNGLAGTSTFEFAFQDGTQCIVVSDISGVRQ